MTPEQFAQLLKLLEKLTDKSYTITGASDWPALVAVGGLLLLAVIAMWADLRSALKDSRCDWQRDLAAHKDDNIKAMDNIWAAHRDCKDDCCDVPSRRAGR